MFDPLRILLVEDSENDALLIMRHLEAEGFNLACERVQSAAAMRVALAHRHWDAIISDFSMPQFGGMEALQIFLESGLDIPFISVSGTMGEETAVKMVKAGAHDYVMKNNLERLATSVKRELRTAQERRVRRQTEATSAYLASIVENCDDAIVGHTLDGTVVSWNAAAERMYGYSASEMIGRPMDVLFPAYRPQESAELLEDVKRGERVGWLDTVRLRKGGSPIEISLVVSPIKDASGRIVGASEVARDITHLKQEEGERLNLIQDLTEALAQATTVAVH